MYKPMMSRRAAPAWMAAALLAGLAAAPVAQAAQAVTWTVNAVFDDGGTLSGVFSVSNLDFMTSWDITTTGPGPFRSEYLPGIFTPTLFSTSNDIGNEIFVGYNDNQELAIDFANSLTTVSSDNAIVTTTAPPALPVDPSFECVNSFTCFQPSGGSIRHIVSGFAVGTPTGAAGGVPEPAAWTLMIAGFGLAGAMLRRRQARIPA